MVPDCSFGLSHTAERHGLEIAHIHALRPGGPRYDPDLTEAETSAPDNLIMLCAAHHAVVDRSPAEFPAPVLASWRTDALARVAAAMVPSSDATSVLNEALRTWQKERSNGDEEFWQRYFTDRPGLLLTLAQTVGVGLKTKCYVGGKSLHNSGGGVLDFIIKEHSNATLIEIKSPTATLLGKEYRQGVWTPSQELLGACMQVLNYRSTLLNEFYSLTRDEPDLEAPDPHCVVLAGDLEVAGMSRSQQRSLALFRRSMSSVTVLTYDELFARLQRSGELLQQGTPV